MKLPIAILSKGALSDTLIPAMLATSFISPELSGKRESSWYFTFTS